MPLLKAKFGPRRLRPRPAEVVPIVRPASEDTQPRDSERDPRWCVCVVRSLNQNSSQQQLVREGVVLDAGEAGARVRFRSKSKLPGTVSIKASRIGLDRLARVIWQDEFDAGLAFVEG